MTAKDYLRQLARMDKRIDALLERRRHYQDMATRGTSRYTAERLGGTSRRSNVEDAVCKLIDLEREINQQTDTYVDAKREAALLIECLCDRRFRNLLTWRYLCEWSWEEVRRGLGYSTIRGAHNLHSAALIQFQKVLDYYSEKA